MSALNTMAFFVPPIFVFILTFIISGFLQRAIVRFWVWLIIPVLVAIFMATPGALFFSGGESHGWALAIFFAYALAGLIASTIGVLLGYFVRQSRIAR